MISVSDLKQSSELYVTDDQRHEINDLALPVLNSNAFNRLNNITFLGILSPRFMRIPNFPIYNKRSHDSIISDGTRADHSMAVAALILDIVKGLNLSHETQKYAVVWGLIHDLATWPLSHTGESSFSTITGVDSRTLRKWMIIGSNKLDIQFSITKAIQQIGIDAEILLKLYDKSKNALGGELRIIWQIINSPITPDSLEGMRRSGLVFEIDVPKPEKFRESILKNLYESAVIEKTKSKVMLTFWRNKAKIYNQFINNPKTIKFESSWSNVITSNYNGITLTDSLELPEVEIIDTVLKNGPPNDTSLKRYKQPLEYKVEPMRKRILSDDFPLENLNNVLTKSKKIAL